MNIHFLFLLKRIPIGLTIAVIFFAGFFHFESSIALMTLFLTFGLIFLLSMSASWLRLMLPQIPERKLGRMGAAIAVIIGSIFLLIHAEQTFTYVVAIGLLALCTMSMLVTIGQIMTEIGRFRILEEQLSDPGVDPSAEVLQYVLIYGKPGLCLHLGHKIVRHLANSIEGDGKGSADGDGHKSRSSARPLVIISDSVRNHSPQFRQRLASAAAFFLVLTRPPLEEGWHDDHCREDLRHGYQNLDRPSLTVVIRSEYERKKEGELATKVSVPAGEVLPLVWTPGTQALEEVATPILAHLGIAKAKANAK